MKLIHMKKETPENNKENQIFYILTLAISTTAIIYLYKKWKEEQRKNVLLEKVLEIREENKEVSWSFDYR